MENESKSYLLKEQLSLLQSRAEKGEITPTTFRAAQNEIITQLREL